MITPNNVIGNTSVHFGATELACHCCGVNGCTRELVDALEELRKIANRPITVLSGYRCEAHNKKCGGVPHSEHPQGKAADVIMPGLTLQEQYEFAERVPAFKRGGIGVYDRNFLHVDVRTTGKARWAQVGGKYVAITKLVAPVVKASRKEDASG